MLQKKHGVFRLPIPPELTSVTKTMIEDPVFEPVDDATLA